MELLEFPKEIPMAVRSPGFVPFVIASSADMLTENGNLTGVPDVEAVVNLNDLFISTSWNFLSSVEKFR